MNGNEKKTKLYKFLKAAEVEVLYTISLAEMEEIAEVEGFTLAEIYEGTAIIQKVDQVDEVEAPEVVEVEEEAEDATPQVDSKEAEIKYLYEGKAQQKIQLDAKSKEFLVARPGKEYSFTEAQVKKHIEPFKNNWRKIG